MKHLLFFITISLVVNSILSQDSLQRIEIGFGQSILFISDSKVLSIRNSSALVIPTSSIMFFAEFNKSRKIQIPFILNIPTEPKQFLINNLIISEPSSFSASLGIEYSLLNVDINNLSHFKLNIGLACTSIINRFKNIKLTPTFFARVQCVRTNSFSMFVGVSYSSRIDTFGFYYGTGTIF